MDPKEFETKSENITARMLDSITNGIKSNAGAAMLNAIGDDPWMIKSLSIIGGMGVLVNNTTADTLHGRAVREGLDTAIRGLFTGGFLSRVLMPIQDEMQKEKELNKLFSGTPEQVQKAAEEIVAATKDARLSEQADRPGPSEDAGRSAGNAVALPPNVTIGKKQFLCAKCTQVKSTKDGNKRKFVVDTNYQNSGEDFVKFDGLEVCKVCHDQLSRMQTAYRAKIHAEQKAQADFAELEEDVKQAQFMVDALEKETEKKKADEEIIRARAAESVKNGEPEVVRNMLNSGAAAALASMQDAGIRHDAAKAELEKLLARMDELTKSK